MTKKELAEKMKAFIAAQSNDDKDEWYVSSQGAADHVLTQFAESLGITLEDNTISNDS